MDLGTLIIGIVFILICIIPFALMIINSRKKEKKQLNGLSDIAQKSKCKLSRYDFWHNSSIGIDDTAYMVFFTRKSKDIETSQQINLTEIKTCRVLNSTRTWSSNDGNNKVIDKLELAFSFHDNQKHEVALEFYNADYDSLTLSGELQLVEKWCGIMNDKISEISKSK